MIVYYVHMFVFTSKLKEYTVSIMKKKTFLRDIDISCIFIEFSFPFKANLMNENKSYLRSSTDNNGPPYYRFDSNGPLAVTVTVLIRIYRLTVTVLIADFYRVDLWARSFDFPLFFSIELFYIFHFLCM